MAKREEQARVGEILDRLGAHYPEAECALRHGDPLQLLVATILSAQCTDRRGNLVTPGLFWKYPDAAAVARASLRELEAAVRTTRFHRNQARNIPGYCPRV